MSSRYGRGVAGGMHGVQLEPIGPDFQAVTV
jgi:hypothetical protein